MIGARPIESAPDLARRAAALAALAAASPILAAAALLIRARMGPPVLFCQRRPGLGARPFVLYKLRTMREASGADADPARDRARTPRLGRALRAWRIDEIPNLWNVARGEMNFVGPRPLLERYLERYDARQARRHEVRPGITGWAQVSATAEEGWRERLERDVWYVENRSLWLDARILGRTLRGARRRASAAAGPIVEFGVGRRVRT